MSVRRLAAARNEASVQNFTAKMNELMRRQSLEEPMKGFDELLERTSANLEALDAGLAQVRRFLADVRERKEAGMLDERTAVAEALPAETVISLAGALRTAFERAGEADNTYPLKRVNIAVQVLAGSISASLLSSVRYPQSDPSIREALIHERGEQAIGISKDVCSSLDGVDAELSLQLPEVRRL